MRTKILKAILYPLFFLMCLVFFLIQGFPVRPIADDYIGRLEQSLGVKVTFESMGTLFPNGIEATGVRLVKKMEGENALPVTISIERLAARISLFSLLAGTKNLSFSSDLLSGQATGTVVLDQDHVAVNTKLSNVNLGKLTFLAEMVGQEFAGSLSGDVDLDIVPKDAKSTRGEVKLTLDQARVGNGKIYGVMLPLFNLGKVPLEISIQKSKAEIKSFKVASPDLEAAVDGYFLLQQRLDSLSAHCRLRFKPSDEKMTAIREQIPPELQKQMLDPELEKARGKDGFFRYSVFGRVFGGKLQFRPMKQ